MKIKEIENISSQIFTSIVKNPSEDILYILHSLNENEQKNIISYFLQFYGGSLSHDFLLKINQLILTYKSSEWREILNKTNYNLKLGEESLFTFFLFHTSIRNTHFFDEIGIDKNLRNRFNNHFFVGIYKDFPYFFKARNIRNYQRLGILEQESRIFNALTAPLEPPV